MIQTHYYRGKNWDYKKLTATKLKETQDTKNTHEKTNRGRISREKHRRLGRHMTQSTGRSGFNRLAKSVMPNKFTVTMTMTVTNHGHGPLKDIRSAANNSEVESRDRLEDTAHRGRLLTSCDVLAISRMSLSALPEPAFLGFNKCTWSHAQTHMQRECDKVQKLLLFFVSDTYSNNDNIVNIVGHAQKFVHHNKVLMQTVCDSDSEFVAVCLMSGSMF
jgi:hypothetical protein